MPSLSVLIDGLPIVTVCTDGYIVDPENWTKV